MLDVIIRCFPIIPSFSLKCHKTRSDSPFRLVIRNFVFIPPITSHELQRSYSDLFDSDQLTAWHLPRRRLTYRLSTVLDQLPRVTYFSPQHVACVFVRDCWQSSFLSWRLWMKILMDTDSALTLYTRRGMWKKYFVWPPDSLLASQKFFFPGLSDRHYA